MDELKRQLRYRYSRQTMFPGIGEEGQAKLARSCVVIIGCGALGCNSAGLLARAGVGRLRIIDRDFVEYHNLHRQTLFDEADVTARLPKAIAAERHLKRVNSTIDIQGIIADANPGNIESLCAGADVIVDALDNFESRFLLNDAALKLKVPWVYGGAVAAEGMTATIIPGETACFRCFARVVPEPGVAPTCETVGVIGPAPAIIGALQASEALKILVGSPAINRELIIIDVWRGFFRKLAMKPRPDCSACRGEYEFLQNQPGVRTTSLCGQSRAIQVVDTGIKRVDLDKLAARLGKSGKVKRYEFLLTFAVDDYEIDIFPDGRAIVRNTLDEALAKEIYGRWVGQA